MLIFCAAAPPSARPGGERRVASEPAAPPGARPGGERRVCGDLPRHRRCASRPSVPTSLARCSVTPGKWRRASPRSRRRAAWRGSSTVRCGPLGLASCMRCYCRAIRSKRPRRCSSETTCERSTHSSRRCAAHARPSLRGSGGGRQMRSPRSPRRCAGGTLPLWTASREPAPRCACAARARQRRSIFGRPRTARGPTRDRIRSAGIRMASGS